MAYPVSINLIEFAITPFCNKLIVYHKTTDGAIDKLGLRVSVNGTMTSKYYRLSLSGSGLSINSVNAPGDTWLYKTFTRDFADDVNLHMTDLWTDDQGAAEIIVGTGDIRDINLAYGFSLTGDLIISSPAEGQLKIYYPTASALITRTI